VIYADNTRTALSRTGQDVNGTAVGAKMEFTNPGTVDADRSTDTTADAASNSLEWLRLNRNDAEKPPQRSDARQLESEVADLETGVEGMSM
jgi:hypothetical protein